jgi:hypothetical protein
MNCQKVPTYYLLKLCDKISDDYPCPKRLANPAKLKIGLSKAGFFFTESTGQACGQGPHMTINR